jgi:hypothetical protein
MKETFKNDAATTLAASCLSTDTTLTVTDATALPSSPVASKM